MHLKSMHFHFISRLHNDTKTNSDTEPNTHYN